MYHVHLITANTAVLLLHCRGRVARETPLDQTGPSLTIENDAVPAPCMRVQCTHAPLQRLPHAARGASLFSVCQHLWHGPMWSQASRLHHLVPQPSQPSPCNGTASQHPQQYSGASRPACTPRTFASPPHRRRSTATTRRREARCQVPSLPHYSFWRHDWFRPCHVGNRVN